MMPTSPSQSYLTRLPSPADLLGPLCELLWLGRLRARGQLERIVVVAGDHVDVQVEDRLPGRAAVRLQEVHAVAVERVAHLGREALSRDRDVRELVVLDLEDVGRVLAR